MRKGLKNLSKFAVFNFFYMRFFFRHGDSNHRPLDQKGCALSIEIQLVCNEVGLDRQGEIPVPDLLIG
jgi:hypothetical protein